MPPLQPSSNNFYPSSSTKRNTLLYGLIALLGVGAVGFAVAAILGFSQAHTATSTLNQQKKAAADAARADQKKQDTATAEIAAESPFRSYVAPVEYGSFEIKFPKNWSGTVDQERSSVNQVALTVHPDFVRRENNVDQLMAAKIMLVQRTLDEYLRQYSNQKGLERSEVTVGGIKSVQIAGAFPDKRTSRLVVVPVRDKILAFINEDSRYNHEFDGILAQSKIVP